MNSKHKNFKVQNILGGVVIAVVILLMYFWLMPDGNWQGMKVVTGETDSVQLPDGSMAFLNGPAQIGYPKKFDEKVRNIKMDGEIYFEVVNKPEQTFVVQTEKGGVETRVGKFIVSTREKKNITIHCIEESVRMIARGKKEILEIDLLATEMSSFTKGDKAISKKPFDTTGFKQARSSLKFSD